MLNGIDISHHQRNIDLGKIHADFVILKATEGNGYTDPMFSTFVKKVTGRRGFYHFARADLNPGKAGAEREAAWFVQTVRPHLTPQTIVALDWEKEEALKEGPEWVEVWLAAVEKALGVKPYFYSNPNVLGRYDWSKVSASHPLWLAYYGPHNRIDGYKPLPLPNVRYWGTNIAIHQYGDRGRLPGYGADLDLNAAYNVPEWKDTPKLPRMQSPVAGRVSSPYGKRSATTHAGIDIAAPLGTLVYPPFPESTVVFVVSGRKRGQTGGHRIPGRTPNGVLLRNPDGEHQWLGHVDPIVKAGQTVYMDTPLGKIDLSGNTNGPHVHLETWRNSSHTSHRDPMIYFNHHGVKPGSEPHFGGKEQGKPPVPVKPKPDQKVLAWQKDLNKYAKAGVVEGGIRGPETIAWETWVGKTQESLNLFKSSRPKLRIDKHYGNLTALYVRDVQRRNKLFVDGIVGPVMIAWMRSHGSKIPNRP